jgi:hypothetical protein
MNWPISFVDFMVQSPPLDKLTLVECIACSFFESFSYSYKKLVNAIFAC